MTDEKAGWRFDGIKKVIETEVARAESGLQELHARRPPQTADQHVGFNGRLGAAITRGVGTMWAFYFAALFMGGWMLLSLVGLLKFDAYPFAFLLFLGNIVQLLLMFVIMVGQNVLGQAADDRAMSTYHDAEAILHECRRIQRHLESQDKEMISIIDRLERLVPPA